MGMMPDRGRDADVGEDEGEDEGGNRVCTGGMGANERYRPGRQTKIRVVRAMRL
jgi:hypothetical protein